MAKNTIRIAIEANLISQKGAVDWIRVMSDCTGKKSHLSLLLFSSAGKSLSELVNQCSKQDIFFDQVLQSDEVTLSRILKEFSVDLVLCGQKSFESSKVSLPICRVLPRQANSKTNEHLHLVFDADAVLFHRDSDRITHRRGIEAFDNHELSNANTPIAPGPLKPFAEKIHRLSQNHPRLSWSVLTARGGKAYQRALTTLNAWDMVPEHLFFMCGQPKSNALKYLDATLFFDDTIENCNEANTVIATAHVL